MRAHFFFLVIFFGARRPSARTVRHYAGSLKVGVRARTASVFLFSPPPPHHRPRIFPPPSTAVSRSSLRWCHVSDAFATGSRDRAQTIRARRTVVVAADATRHLCSERDTDAVRNSRQQRRLRVRFARVSATRTADPSTTTGLPTCAIMRCRCSGARYGSSGCTRLRRLGTAARRVCDRIADAARPATAARRRRRRRR